MIQGREGEAAGSHHTGQHTRYDSTERGHGAYSGAPLTSLAAASNAGCIFFGLARPDAPLAPSSNPVGDSPRCRNLTWPVSSSSGSPAGLTWQKSPVQTRCLAPFAFCSPKDFGMGGWRRIHGPGR